MNFRSHGVEVTRLVFFQAAFVGLDAALDIPSAVRVANQDTSLGCHQLAHEIEPGSALVAKRVAGFRRTQQFYSAGYCDQSVVCKPESGMEEILKVRLVARVAAVNDNNVRLACSERL